ncbi:MAG: biotin synthase BioB [Planctomycetaceae bacterium]|jgi:biotin synthase|nr:biotin synthase BioB [Planctomycetaceae bacterium]
MMKILEKPVLKTGTLENLAEYGMSLATETPLEDLLESATKIREKHFGRKIEFCMISNAKCGLCRNDCHFCSQSAHYATEISSYPLHSAEQLSQEASSAAECGAFHFGIVTSGATLTRFEVEQIAESVREMTESGKIKMCASLGKLERSALETLKEAGLVRYHHNLETSEAFYPEICTTQQWRDRYNMVRLARESGMEVCSGTLFGMGETWQDRIDLALTLRELEVTCVPMNFLHAHPGTPLAEEPPLSADEALRIIAVYRHLLPETSLRICGGRPKILAEKQSMMFAAGADAVMTGNYLTTSGITPETDARMVEQLGLSLLKL